MHEIHLEKRGQSMAYNLRITEYAAEQLDNLVYYLLYQLKNEQAAIHLLDLLKKDITRQLYRRWII